MATMATVHGSDPRKMLANAPMTVWQVLAIGTCALLNALDGFDVLSISFASPGIAKEWGIERAALGFVLSLELIGMAVGSVVLGQLADRIGRRPTTLACLAIMALGMLSTSFAGSLGVLAATRLATGLGIGGMLATTNALVAEYANNKWRAAVVAIMAGGYPIGAVAGGAIASRLLVDGSWRHVFLLGAGMAALCLPLALLLLPEPVSAILQNRRGNVLARVNRSLRALGHRELTAIPELETEAKVPKSGFARLFSGGLAPTTILLTGAYFTHMVTFYFVLKWVPKIVADMGFAASAAGGVLVWTNVGSVSGSLLFSLLSLRFGLRGLLVAFMLAGTAAVIAFGRTDADLASLSLAGAIAGFFTNGAVVGLYALIAGSFPTAVRGGGTGFVIGMGRGGAALGPILGGALFQSGLALPGVAAVMAGGSILAAVAVLALPKQTAEGH